MKKIAVFCGSSAGNDVAFENAAKAVGVYFAENNIELVFGGGKVGLMGIIADSVLAHGGKVTGVIPVFLEVKEIMHPNVTKMFVTDTMHERKKIMYDMSDAIIALPGGFGTLDELFESLTWSQLMLHTKPVGILNVAGFFDPLFEMVQKMVDKGFLKKINRDLMITDTDIEALIKKLRAFEPTSEGKHVFKQELKLRARRL